jgi:outer membrane murein-binding lipoprotein Lpp
MAVPRALGIKINKLSIEVAELTKRVEKLEALLEAELARGHMATEKAPKAATKRRRSKKAT